ncbi:hypothetical protein [Microbacterium sp. 1P10AE]|uniref:hypothetical protein n=1 Tax=Microbacterium sp. 1P10AE TaxID=3132286 RepID=UPI0039A3BBE8
MAGKYELYTDKAGKYRFRLLRLGDRQISRCTKGQSRGDSHTTRDPQAEVSRSYVSRKFNCTAL